MRRIHNLEAQAPVELEAAPRKELVLENESDRLSDFGSFAQTPQRNGGGHLCQCLGFHAGDHGRSDKSGRHGAHAD